MSKAKYAYFKKYGWCTLLNTLLTCDQGFLDYCIQQDSIYLRSMHAHSTEALSLLCTRNRIRPIWHWRRWVCDAPRFPSTAGFHLFHTRQDFCRTSMMRQGCRSQQRCRRRLRSGRRGREGERERERSVSPPDLPCGAAYLIKMKKVQNSQHECKFVM